MSDSLGMKPRTMVPQSTSWRMAITTPMKDNDHGHHDLENHFIYFNALTLAPITQGDWDHHHHQQERDRDLGG